MKIHWMFAASLALSLGACQRPQAVPTEQKPEPRATVLHGHIQEPLNMAHAVHASTDQVGEDPRKTSDAATQ